MGKVGWGAGPVTIFVLGIDHLCQVAGAVVVETVQEL